MPEIDALLAAMRRLYLHAKAGGTVTERDMARLIERLEEIQTLAASKR